MFAKKFTFIAKCFTVILSILMFAELACAQTVPLTVEAYWDQDIPGLPADAQFGFMDLPILNSSGQIAFMARMKTGSSEPFFTSAWTKKEDGQLTLLVQDGMEARTVSNSAIFAQHSSFNINPLDPGRPASIAINDEGECAFSYYLEDLNNPGALFSSAWVGVSMADLRPVVFDGMARPDTGTFEGIAFERINSGDIAVLFLNNLGQVAFASPEGSTSTGTIWLEDSVCGSDDSLTAVTEWMKNHIYDLTNIGLLGHSYHHTIVEDKEGIWFVGPNTFTPLVLEGEQGPGMEADEAFYYLRGAIFNHSGAVAFNGYSTANREYLYVYTINGDKRLIAVTNDRIISPLYLLDDGRVVYFYALTKPSTAPE